MNMNRIKAKAVGAATLIIPMAFPLVSPAQTLEPGSQRITSTVQAGSVVSDISDTHYLEVPDGMYAVVSLELLSSSRGNVAFTSFSAMVGGVKLTSSSPIEVTRSSNISVSIKCTPDQYCNPYNVIGYFYVNNIPFPRYMPTYHYYQNYYAKQTYALSVLYYSMLPDLHISSAWFSESAVAVDESAVLNVVVANRGRTGTAATSLLRIMKGGIKAVDDITVPALGAGESFTRAINLGKHSAGNHTFEIAVDAGGSIGESNESNNRETRMVRVFTRSPVEVRLDMNGAGDPITMPIVAGQNIGQLPIMARRGYDFKGWWSAASGGDKIDSSERITQARTFFAHWTARRYTVSLNRQGGESGSETVMANFGSVLPQITVPKRFGYDFGGYWSRPGGTGVQYCSTNGAGTVAWDVEGGVSLYAKWTAKKVSIDLDDAGGTGGSGSVRATFGEPLPNVKTPSRSGMVFLGYYSEANGEGEQYYYASGKSMLACSFLEAPALVAAWRPANSKQTLTFDRQGGTGGTSSIVAKYAEMMPTITPPTRSGYAFAGYFSASGGGGTRYYGADGTCIERWDGAAATKLYAHWVKAYSVTLDPNGGTGSKIVHRFGYGDWKLPKVSFSKSGQVFAGWATEPNGVPVYADEASLSKELLGYGDTADDVTPVTLYAKWGVWLTSSKHSGFSFVTGGDTAAARWFEENGKLRSARRGGTSWICTVTQGRGSFRTSWTNVSEEASAPAFSISSGSGMQYSNDPAGAEFTVTVGRHLITLATSKNLHLHEWSGMPESDEEGNLNALLQKKRTLLAETKSAAAQVFGELVYYYVCRERDYYTRFAGNKALELMERYYSERQFKNARSCGDFVRSKYSSEEGINIDLVKKSHLSEYNEFFDLCSSVRLLMEDVYRIEAFKENFLSIDEFKWVADNLVSFVVDTDAPYRNAGAAADAIEMLTQSLDNCASELGEMVSWVMYDGVTEWYESMRSVIKQKVHDGVLGMQEGGEFHDDWKIYTINYILCYRILANYYTGDISRSGMGSERYGAYESLCDRIESILLDIRALRREMTNYGVMEWRLVASGAAVGTLPVPEEREGYVFGGWFTSPSGGTRVSETSRITWNTALFARWTIEEHTVSFDSDAGIAIPARTYKHGERLGSLPVPHSEGLAFEGWYYNIFFSSHASEHDLVQSDRTLYANWTEGVDVDMLGRVDGKASAPIAIWGDKASCRVLFNANGGTGGTTREVAIGSRLGDGNSLPTPKRTGYTFAGWWTAQSGGVKVSTETMVIADVTYYAHWALDEYTVTYRKYDGSGAIASETLRCGRTYPLAWLGSDLGWSRTGYVFAGWVPWNPDTEVRLCKYANGQPVKDLAKAGGTCNLWAVWSSPASYRICYHRCAGVDDTEKMDQVVLRNKEDYLAWIGSQIGWERKDYTFAGWAETANGPVKYKNGARVSNLAAAGGTKHLYAVWSADSGHRWQYKVRFNKFDGTGETRDATFRAGSVQRLPWIGSQLGWTRVGYDFAGWSAAKPDSKPRLCKYANGQEVVDLAAKSGEVVGLWAVWRSPSSYSVCFHKNDGADLRMNQIFLKNETGNLAWLDSQIGWKRNGYVFKGWAESEKGAVKYANGAKVSNLAASGGTKHLYAIWGVAD